MDDKRNYVVYVDSVEKKQRTFNGESTLGGRVVVDELIFNWTLFSSNRHRNDIGFSDRNGAFAVLVPTRVIRTKPTGWMSGNEAPEVKRLIILAAENEEEIEKNSKTTIEERNNPPVRPDIPF